MGDQALETQGYGLGSLAKRNADSAKKWLGYGPAPRPEADVVESRTAPVAPGSPAGSPPATPEEAPPVEVMAPPPVRYMYGTKEVRKLPNNKFMYKEGDKFYLVPESRVTAVRIH